MFYSQVNVLNIKNIYAVAVFCRSFYHTSMELVAYLLVARDVVCSTPSATTATTQETIARLEGKNEHVHSFERNPIVDLSAL